MVRELLPTDLQYFHTYEAYLNDFTLKTAPVPFMHFLGLLKKVSQNIQNVRLKLKSKENLLTVRRTRCFKLRSVNQCAAWKPQKF